jgi:chromosome segregation ATPase
VAELRARAGDTERLAAEQLAEREGRIGELDSLLATLQEQHSARETELEQVRARAEQADGELTEARALIARFEQQVGEQASRAEQLEADAAAVGDQLAAAVASRAAESRAHADTRERLGQTVAELFAERTKLQESEANLDLAHGQLTALRAEETESAAEIRAQIEQATALVLAARSESEAVGARLAETDLHLAQERAGHAETRRVLVQLAEALGELSSFHPEAPAAREEADASSEDGFVCFLPSVTGYQLIHINGPMPDAGDAIDLNQARYLVAKVGRSPLPFDRRRCAYLQAAPTPTNSLVE